ncbi:MAG: class I SAM-dependent methyltransferase [Candidatus Bipolaricaulota bacterium]|nr:class I SAM-dependent methyltransferase [Candidatus Bipolaricaulota bacterium]
MEWWQSFFDETTGQIMFYEEAWQRAEQSCDALVSLLGLQPGAKILDLACGPGRFAIPLARRSFRVVGLDICEIYLEQARAKAKEHGLQIEFVHGDMRAIPFESEFDAVINLFTSFGYFEREEDHLQVLKEVRKSLKPGGRFLLELQNRDWLIKHFQARDWAERPGCLVLEERKLNLERSRVESRWIVLTEAERKEYTLSLRVFTLAELLELFAQAGLKVLGYYSNLRGEPWSLEANRLALLAERESSR